jgi:hypothetical protein
MILQQPHADNLCTAPSTSYTSLTAPGVHTSTINLFNGPVHRLWIKFRESDCARTSLYIPAQASPCNCALALPAKDRSPPMSCRRHACKTGLCHNMPPMPRNDSINTAANRTPHPGAAQGRTQTQSKTPKPRQHKSRSNHNPDRATGIKNAEGNKRTTTRARHKSETPATANRAPEVAKLRHDS